MQRCAHYWLKEHTHQEPLGLSSRFCESSWLCVSNPTSVIDIELVREAPSPILPATPQFKAALDRFALHRLSHFVTAFKLDHALVDGLNPWWLTKLLDPTVQHVNQRSDFKNWAQLAQFGTPMYISKPNPFWNQHKLNNDMAWPSA